MKKIGELEMKRTLENVQETVNYSFFFTLLGCILILPKLFFQRRMQKCLKIILTYKKKQLLTILTECNCSKHRSRWPRGLRRSSAPTRLLRLCVRIPLGHGCLSVVSVVCCQVEGSATS